jgi:FkbM family methyltransferase
VQAIVLIDCGRTCLRAKDLTDAHVALQLFPGYTEIDEALFESFLNPNAKPEPGFITDFLGCRIRATSLWKEARKLAGEVSGIPVPGDFHAEAIEWIGLLKAVRGAAREYVAMELGAGFGPWIIAGATAALSRGIEDIRLCAVEGDPQHFQFLRQHFIDNGFDPNRHRLIEAAVGVRAGVAHWPVVEGVSAADEWGLRPMESSQDYTGRHFQKTTQVNVIPMRELVAQEPCWDLIHIDVQGDEVDICRSCVDELNARVRWIVVGTHSRKLDGDFLDLMSSAGWFLEHEKPARFTFAPNAKLEAMTTVDGTQVWRNPRLTTLHRGDRLSSFSQEITSPISQFNVKAGEIYTLSIKVKNTGTEPWIGGESPLPVNASYRWLDSEGHILPIEGRRALLNVPVLQPGEEDTLNLEIAASPKPGKYLLWISMVQEGVSWFIDRSTKPLALQVTIHN